MSGPLSPKAGGGQPTPFSIADILSRAPERDRLLAKAELLGGYPRLGHFLGVDLLRRNLAQASLFPALQQQQLEEARLPQRQQDEALDMSKSKYLGERYFREVEWPLGRRRRHDRLSTSRWISSGARCKYGEGGD